MKSFLSLGKERLNCGERLRKILKNLFCSLFIITLMCGDGNAKEVVIDSNCTLAATGLGYFDFDVNPDYGSCDYQSEETFYVIGGYIYRVISCTSCLNGADPTTVTKTYHSADLPDGGDCQISYQTCGGCNGCDETCIDDPEWSIYQNIYKKKVFRDCECNNCVESPLYLCANDYYDENGHTSGVTSTSLLNCKKCPTSTINCNDWTDFIGKAGVESCVPNVPNGCTRTFRYRCKSGYYDANYNGTEWVTNVDSLNCQKCPTMAELENDTTTPWRSAGQTGYEIRSLTNPAPKVCSEVAQYRCASGYWGVAQTGQTLSGGLSGCTRCATIMGVQSSSVAGENATRNKCCVKKGDRAKVTGGILEIDEPCCDDA